MYECEVRVPFMRDGKKVLEWTVKPVSSLGSGAQRGIRCMHCAGEVRVHKQKVPHGPADHVEHLRTVDSRNCRSGHHFEGTHKRSDQPVE